MQWLHVSWTAVLAMCFALPTAQARQDNEQEKLFENHVRPVLVERCVKCHGPSKSESGLRVDKLQLLLKGGDSGAAIKAGDSAASLLMQAVDWQHDIKMPPDKALDPITIDAIKRWIDGGAYWPEQVKLSSGPELRSGPPTQQELQFWSLLPLKDYQPPKYTLDVEPTKSDKPNISTFEEHSGKIAKSSEAIDAFIQEKLRQQELSPSKPADRQTLIRRIAFDLTGLPPSADEIKQFVEDSSPDAYSKLVERLLASKAYGERWGRHWMDVVRYSDSAGETADYPVPDAWKYRNYVIDAFNKDKPYDQFLREQIAGDILARQAGSPEEFSEKTIATGYIAIARRFGFDSENYHHLTIQDTIDTLGQTALGISLGCARCHDHKFDPISMEDYYALYGIFESTLYPLSGSEQKQKVRSLASLAGSSDPLIQLKNTNELAAKHAALKRLGRNAPPAILRSLTEMDGDFELQSPAAGGSRGVLVAPWLYDGPVSATNAGQSPFADQFPAGKVGVSLPAGKAVCRVWQSLNHRQANLMKQAMMVSFDFRFAQSGKQDCYSLSLTNEQLSEVMEIRLHSDLTLRIGSSTRRLASIQPSTWYQVNLRIDLEAKTVSGFVKAQDNTLQQFDLEDVVLGDSQLTSSDVQHLVIGSAKESLEDRPAVELDNISIVPLTSTSTSTSATREATSLAGSNSQSVQVLPEDPAPLREELKKLTGIDGEFEYQTDDKPPVAPWGPGPNSVVKISRRAQSPLIGMFERGELGITMPNRGEYDGFGMQLDKLQPDADGLMYGYFEFSCASQERGGDGSWRYYLGHGPGNSAAIELFFTGKQFFARRGDARDPVAELKIGNWYRVLVELNTVSNTYRGWLMDEARTSEFGGAVASGWDGVIDYTFIDSYGHIGGVRPELFADNFFLLHGSDRKNATEKQDVYAWLKSTKLGQPSNRGRVGELRNKLAELQAVGDQIEQQLQQSVQGMAYAVAEGTPHDVNMQIRGEPTQPGKLVARRLPALFASVGQANGKSVTDSSNSDSGVHVDAAQDKLSRFRGSGRLELARWLTEDARALTARVMVNRIWQQHFGRGLVRTENDFGTRGEAPTHPELLDWLACRFIESGWSIKHMHRLIVHTQAYQQASTVPSKPSNASPTQDSQDSVAGLGSTSKHLQVDPENRYLWRFSPRRLSAEEIRDAMLKVSGMLDSSPGQEHPFPSPHSWGFTQHTPFYAVYETNRRSVYIMQQRLKRHPFLALFDGADPNVSTARREMTTVPTQALYLMNNAFVHEAGKKLAERFAEQDSIDQRIGAMFACTLGRSARADEIERSKVFLDRYRRAVTATTSQQSGPSATDNSSFNDAAWAALGRSLITRNEFLFVE